MSASVFPDTNILIYAIEDTMPLPARTVKARAVVAGTNWMISTQVLGEFYRATTSKRRAVLRRGLVRIIGQMAWPRSTAAEYPSIRIRQT